MFSTSTSGLKTSTTPTSTSVSWLRKSMTASTMFTLTASLTPRTFTSASSAISATPKTTSPGDVEK